MERSYYWEHPDDPQIQNQAEVSFEPDGLRANGIQIGPGYSARWILEALDDWTTQAIHVHVLGEGWNRMLKLERDSDGVWTSETSVSGEQPAELAAPDTHPGIAAADQYYSSVDERTVRYKSGTRGVDVELQVDEDGVVLHYPDLARRL